jgi:hypothetical protein
VISINANMQSGWKANKDAYITLDFSENEWYSSGSHTGAGELPDGVE